MRILVTGSADGLGKAAAQELLRNGHDVVVHVRHPDRVDAVRDLLDRGAELVIGDLADMAQTRQVADQVNALGRMDAVIHNAGVYSGPAVIPVNVVAALSRKSSHPCVRVPTDSDRCRLGLGTIFTRVDGSIYGRCGFPVTTAL